MSDVSTGLRWAWIIAANEAIILNSQEIEPIHFLLGIFKLVDISNDIDRALPDVTEEEKKQIILETSKLKHILEVVYKIPVSNFRRNIRKQFSKDSPTPQIEEIGRSDSTRKLFEELFNFCDQKSRKPTVEAFLYIILKSESETMSPLFREINIDLSELRDSVIKEPEKGSDKEPDKEADKDYASDYGRNLTVLAKENKLSEAIGRESEIREIGRVLLQKTKPNALVIGEAGVGKTAVIESLALFIASGKCPKGLKDKEIFELSLSSLIAGAKFKGEFEERLSKVINEVRDRKIILFIDEFHNIMGAGGGSEGTMNIANIIKPVLARGDVQVIGATTIDEYRKHIEKDPAIERRFQMVHINEPDAQQATKILEKLSLSLQQHYKVNISSKAIEETIRLSIRYMPSLRLPDKAITVLESACARKLFPSIIETGVDEGQNESGGLENTVTEQDVYNVISKRCNIPLENLSGGNSTKYLELEKELANDIIGQDAVISDISESLRMAKAGLNLPNSPKAVFFFVGSSGVGKTAIAKALSRVVFGSEDNLIRFDMSEYHEKHGISKLIGAPPGYLGYDEEGLLIKRVRSNPNSVLLFDEIEKAHQDIQDIFLQVLDNGSLTASNGRTANFRDTIIIFTSNLGSRAVANKPAKVGFKTKDEADNKSSHTPDWKISFVQAVKGYFKPEFVNRLQKILVFERISKDSAKLIQQKLLDELTIRLSKIDLSIHISEEVKDFLLDRGFSLEFGVRNLERTIAKEISEPLSRFILEQELKNSNIHVFIENEVIQMRLQ